MKIILLVITIILLISRIKNTPRMLSKSLYYIEMQKAINKNRINEIPEEEKEIYKGAAIILVIIMQLLIFIYYILVGHRIGTPLIVFLSATQAVTVIDTVDRTIKEIPNIFSTRARDFKFYRYTFLFNVILDYIYYPLVIYMLLKGE